MAVSSKVSLLVRNIALSTETADLRKVFEKFGEIRDVYTPMDFHTKVSCADLTPKLDFLIE
jgi:RNA recognition motif-containing protein